MIYREKYFDKQQFYQYVNPYGRFTLDLTQRIPLSLTKIA